MECRQLPSLILLFAVLAGAAFAEATTAYCNSCASCTAALNNVSNDIVYLNTSISTSGSCINNPANFSNKTFDCQGHTITGTKSGNGITINSNQTNDIIENCQVTAFVWDVWLGSVDNTVLRGYVSNITVFNNTLTDSSLDLIETAFMYNSTIANNTLHDAGHEDISFDQSVNNLIVNNSISNSTQQCIEFESSNGNNVSYNTLWLCAEAFDFHWQQSSSNNNTITYNNISQSYTGLSITAAADYTSPQGNVFAYNTINLNDPANWSAVAGGMPQRDSFASPCADMGFEYRDIELWGEEEAECNNSIYNNTGTGGLPIYFINTAVNLSDITASQILLCNADGSILDNVTVASGKHVNSLALYYSDNVTVTNSVSNGNSVGFEVFNSGNNTFIGNTAEDNFYYDFLPGLSQMTPENNTLYYRACSNRIEDFTGSGGYPIYFINTKSSLSNVDASEIVLCAADDSVLTNVTIHPSALVKNNGIVLFKSHNVTIDSSTVSNAFIGIFEWILNGDTGDAPTGAHTFSNNLLENCSCEGYLDWDMTGNSTLLYNNTIRYNRADGAYTAWNMGPMALVQNRIYGNGYTGVEVGSSNISLIGNEIHNNSQGGIYTWWADGMTAINNSIYSNGFDFTDPFYFAMWYGSPSYFTGSGIVSTTQYFTGTTLTLENNAIYGNKGYGLFVNVSDDNIASSNDHLYGNGAGEVYLQTDSRTKHANFTNLSIDNPAGNFQNYTSVAIVDVLNANSAYSIKWITNSAPIPSGNSSFAQKFISITKEAGSPSIDKITFNWLDSELTGYTESKFKLYKYNTSNGWTLLNSTPDTSANTLTTYKITSTSEYGVLDTYHANVSLLELNQTALQASPGGVVQFSITTTNMGNAILNGTITDLLSTNLTFASASPENTTEGPVWAFTGLEPGDSLIYYLNATVNPGVVNAGVPILTLSNYANATGVPPSGNNVTAESSADVTVYYANVSILKLDITPLPPSQGGIAQYYIVVTNTGNITLNPVELTDALPEGFTFNSTDTPNYTLSGNNVSWGNVGPLSPGSPVTILLNASVDAETPSGNYSNTANAQGTPPNGGDVFASDTAYTGVNSSAINLVKTASNYSVIMHGNITFVLNITNSGEVNLTTLVSDALPNGVSLIDALPEPDYTIGNTLYWNTIGILPSGEHFEIVYTASMDSDGAKTNNAVATGIPPNGENATDSASVTIDVLLPPEEHRGVFECITDTDCNSCYECRSNKCILTAGACAADSDCPGAGYSCEGCRCISPECTKSSDCAQGYTCLNYECKQPECWENSDCSNGKICDSFKCVEKTPEGTPPWPTENSTTGIPVKPEEKPPLITPEQPKPIQVVSTTVPLVGAQQKPVSPFPESAVYLLAAVLAMIIAPGAYLLLKARHEHARHGRMGH